MGAIDRAMNTTQQAKGKVKEVAGTISGDDRLRRQGKADQRRARLKQTGERIKARLRQVTPSSGRRTSGPNRRGTGLG
jgi:uncharacterized protein YjbJ (UPF0337 family)